MSSYTLIALCFMVGGYSLDSQLEYENRVRGNHSSSLVITCVLLHRRYYIV